MDKLVNDKKTQIVITDPKSYSSIRTIPLPDFIMELLKKFQGSDNEYFLTGESERFIEPRTMQNHFKLYIKEAAIDNANFHSLRHTFATRCVELGFDIKTLSEILGHSSVKITLDGLNYLFSKQRKKDYEELIILKNTVAAFVKEIEEMLPPLTQENLAALKEDYFTQRGSMVERQKNELATFKNNHFITLDTVANKILD